MAHGHRHGAHYHHDHAHGHSHAPAALNRAFAIATALNLGFVIAEVVFGLLAHSLALVADAAHNLSDVVGLLLAWGAGWLARREPTEKHTYGFRRASIYAALANAALLFVAVGGIVIEALRRFSEPEPVAETTVIVLATIGIVINTATALLFVRGQHDLNVRGAFLHMAADAAVSAGVVVAALLIMATGWQWLDPAASLAIAAVILVGTWSLAREAVDLSLDAVPAGVDRAAVNAYLSRLDGVSEVHDLHIWAMSTTETALTAHLVRPGAALDDHFLADVCAELSRRFAIGHATLQIESGDPAHPCRLAPHEVV
jgi:cobalt-zinc-cadmium efflux system protein